MLLAQQSLFDPTRAPEGKHTAWAYCHVPNGCDVDMTARIEAQIERFAPGFRDRILARHTLNPAQMERYNANYIGGDINGGVQDLGQIFTRPVVRLDPYSTPNKRALLLLVIHPTGRRGPWDVRLLRGALRLAWSSRLICWRINSRLRVCRHKTCLRRFHMPGAVWRPRRWTLWPQALRRGFNRWRYEMRATASRNPPKSGLRDRRWSRQATRARWAELFHSPPRST